MPTSRTWCGLAGILSSRLEACQRADYDERVYRTRLTELLGIRHPIVQGGLSRLAYAELAAAVSNAGGLGQVTATSLGSVDEVRAQIERARRLTERPFAVNFAISERRTYIADWVTAALEVEVPALSFTAGNPEPFIRQARQARGDRVKVLVLVASVRQAQKAEEVGADAVIAVGQEGGGHIGRDDTGTLVLVPRVVDSVRVPVVASGGIADGRGLAAALALGADGIEMGTRFVATQECVAHPAYKQALVERNELDTRVIERSVGRPARTLNSRHVERILTKEAEGATLEELLPLISWPANVRAAVEGQLDDGFVWAGQGVGLIRDVPTVAELIERTVREAEQALDRFRRQ
jgi:NAD(P)H-dependent flavin oxidoreductase YrpB (nitropropane dioxygenase family)